MGRARGRETEIEIERGPGQGTGDGAGAETAGTVTETDIIEEETGGTDPVTDIVTDVTETEGDRDHVTGDNLRLRGKLKFWNWTRNQSEHFFYFSKLDRLYLTCSFCFLYVRWYYSDILCSFCQICPNRYQLT